MRLWDRAGQDGVHVSRGPNQLLCPFPAYRELLGQPLGQAVWGCSMHGME